MKNVGKVIKNTAVVAFAAIPLLLAPSCQNDNVGKLLNERADLERKKDSVAQLYTTKIEMLKSGTDETFRLVPMIDGLCKQREEAVKPFADSIDSINIELRKSDIFGKPLR